jgi:hypothetical protein
MRAFVTILGVDDSGGIPILPYTGRFWDGASTLFAFSRSMNLSADTVEADIRHAIIDDLVSYLSGHGLVRSDVVFVS